MNKELFIIGMAFSILFIASATQGVLAQNLTTNVSNAAGNASANVNKTATEMGSNVSNSMGNASNSANQTMSELGKNTSNTMSNASGAINQTVGELGKNASSTGEMLLNKTGEVAKKLVGGAATVLGNISGEIKKGLGEK